MSDDLTQVFGDDGFDTDSVPAQVNFKPPGKYPCLIQEAELKKNSKGTGLLIHLVLSVLEGPHKNWKFYCNINIKHSESPECVEIGLRTLSSLGKALGLQNVTNLNQVRGQRVLAHATVKKEQNVINVFSSISMYIATPEANSVPLSAPSAPPTLSDVAPPSAPPVEPSSPAPAAEPWRNPPG